MRQIQGKLVLLRVSGEFEFPRVTSSIHILYNEVLATSSINFRVVVENSVSVALSLKINFSVYFCLYKFKL